MAATFVDGKLTREDRIIISSLTFDSKGEAYELPISYAFSEGTTKEEICEKLLYELAKKYLKRID